MLKTFSETISTGADLYQAPTLSKRMIWRGYRKPEEILTIPEEYRTKSQKEKVEVDPTKLEKIRRSLWTPKQIEIMRVYERGKKEEERARGRKELGAPLGSWTRWKPFPAAVEFRIGFPGLKRLTGGRVPYLAERTVEQLSARLDVTLGEMATAVKKAVIRSRITSKEAQILEGLGVHRIQIKSPIIRSAENNFVEYYQKDIGWY